MFMNNVLNFKFATYNSKFEGIFHISKVLRIGSFQDTFNQILANSRINLYMTTINKY